jgi:hypothetical protein
MTLKEKFENIIYNYVGSEWNRRDVSNSLEKDSDEFAIGFAEFIAEKTINYQDGKFRIKTLAPIFKTPKELLEIYKKEKGL